MIRENQELLNRLNVLGDGLIVYVSLPLAYWLRFYVLPGGLLAIPLFAYLRRGVVFTAIQLFTFASFGLYQSHRATRLQTELGRLFRAELVDMALLLSWLFLGHNEHYSRGVFGIYLALSAGILAVKRTLLRGVLRSLRRGGRNQKRVLVIGGGVTAARYLVEIERSRELGYEAVGYIARHPGDGFRVPYLGGYEALDKLLRQSRADEVVSAIEMGDYSVTPAVLEACEKAGVKLSIIPFYADYMPAHPQIDDLNGIPLMNVRRIPLDNFGNAFMKRAEDIIGASVMLLALWPVMLVCAIGVRLSSPGPVVFKQTRVGKDRKPFQMLKFRSLRLNDTQDTVWSTRTDDRRTKWGAFLRKFSLDELPQLWCVLKGDMSLVGPRPEIPYFVDRFKDEVPLYMVRHQVRPGITGWAQVNGFRGDTPIRERIEHDIYYIENWSVWFDIQILLATVFRGKFIADEEL